MVVDLLTNPEEDDKLSTCAKSQGPCQRMQKEEGDDVRGRQVQREEGDDFGERDMC